MTFSSSVSWDEWNKWEIWIWFLIRTLAFFSFDTFYEVKLHIKFSRGRVENEWDGNNNKSFFLA